MVFWVGFYKARIIQECEL